MYSSAIKVEFKVNFIHYINSTALFEIKMFKVSLILFKIAFKILFFVICLKKVFDIYEYINFDYYIEFYNIKSKINIELQFKIF